MLEVYRATDRADAKVKIIGALKGVRSKNVSAFLREEYGRSSSVELRGALLQSLAAQPLESSNLPLLLGGLRQEDPEVVRACVHSLIQFKPDLDESLANVLVSRLVERRSLFYDVGNALAVLSGRKPPNFKPEPEPGERLEETTRAAAIDFWRDWYQQRFQKGFVPATTSERSDEEIRQFILGAESTGGDATRGAKVYEAVQCNTCHGGGVTPGREGGFFGPDLSGVTRRLSRADLADALVYPSKQVADRFKAFEIELKDSTSLTGFITEQSEDVVSLADREQVHRIARSRIRSMVPQSTSLMPDHLLNRLGRDEIRDLLAFLDEGRQAVPDGGQGAK